VPDTSRSNGFRATFRTLSGRISLRAKLISAVVAMVTIALAVISFAGISVLSRYLIGQADNQLASLTTENSLARQLQGYLQNPEPVYTRGEALYWVPKGGKLQQIGIPVSVTGIGRPTPEQVVAGPQLPNDASSLPSPPQRATTVGAADGGKWRVIGIPVFNSASSSLAGTIVVGLDVTSTYKTIGELTGIDVIVSLVIIAGIAIVGIAVVRRSLRPLTDIERTAEAIAAGDLARRVPDRDPRTEVGRLGRSLNMMLAQIESAFHARSESEHAARRSEDKMRQFVADASHELRTPLTAIRGFAEYYRQRGGADLDQAQLAAGNGAAANPADLTTDPAGTSGPASAADHTGTAGRAADAGDQKPLARAELDRIMRRVEQESSRMGVLVEDMLLLARLDQQRALDYRPVDLLTLAADAVHDARVVAPDRSIDLTVGAGAALIVQGDEVRLRQVIGNLMSNALTHTPDGTPIEVRVRSGTMAEQPMASSGSGAPSASSAVHQGPGPAAEQGFRPATGPSPVPEPPPAVILEVADQGPGLTPDQAGHVFERFYRADQARSRKAGGTGLGLAIVAALVAAHDGAVWVESPPGGGATFRIALPLAPEARQSEPDPAETTQPGIIGSDQNASTTP
jgi:two-component system, OmpR family, sensor kinase